MGSFEELQVYQLAEKLANRMWFIIAKWDNFAKETIGKQLVRAVDSIGANIAEGNGRYNHKDKQRFIKIARGSLYETRHWLRLAFARNLLKPEEINDIKLLLEELSPKLNAYLNSIKQQENTKNQEPRTTNNEQRTTNKEQRTTNNEQRTKNNEQRTTNNQLRTKN